MIPRAASSIRDSKREEARQVVAARERQEDVIAADEGGIGSEEQEGGGRKHDRPGQTAPAVDAPELRDEVLGVRGLRFRRQACQGHGGEER